MVWGIASREQSGVVESYVDSLGLTFPILLDEDGAVSDLYPIEFAFPTAAYPRDWIVGSDGVVVYVSNELELSAMQAVIEGEL